MVLVVPAGAKDNLAVLETKGLQLFKRLVYLLSLFLVSSGYFKFRGASRVSFVVEPLRGAALWVAAYVRGKTAKLRAVVNRQFLFIFYALFLYIHFAM